MKYDKPLIAALIMMLSAIPGEIMTQFFKYFGLNQLSASELTSIMMYKEGNWWIGLLTLPGTAGLAGLLIYELARKLGSDYLPLKSAGFTTVTYGLIAAVFGTLGRNPKFAELTVSGHYVHASTAFLAGLLGGFLIKRYLFNDNEAIQKKRVRRYRVVPEPVLKKKKKITKRKFVS